MLLQVDPQLLFQRLVLAARSTVNTEDVFSHELCNHPPALFGDAQMMTESHKSVLADIISNLAQQSITELPRGDIDHVIDGGSLLYRIP